MRRTIRYQLEEAGLYQALTYSLTSDALAQKYALETAPTTRLLMPMSEERSTLRQSVLPHLIESLVYNISRQADTVALYEIGSVFLGETAEGLPLEREHVALAMTGKWVENAWQGEHKQVDFFVLKGALEALFEKLSVADRITYVAAKVDGMHPGRTADILLDGERIGFLGQLHPQEQKNLGVKDTFVAEFNLAQVLAADIAPLQYVAVPRFPSISRDIALVVDRTTTAASLEEIITAAGGKLLKAVNVFDVYEGDHMEAGKKSIAFSLTYFDPERTLTDEDVTAVHDKVVAALQENGVTLR